VQYRRKDAAPGKKGPKKGKDMNELKQELDIDDHKIPIEELYQRLGTNPETVNFSLFCLSVRPSVCVSHFPYLSMTSSPQRFFLGTRWQMAHTHTISFVFPFATTTTTPSQPYSTSLFLPSPSP
jgi:hypothetical protein